MSFQPTGLGLQIFQSRHAAHENETWSEGCARVATHVVQAEPGAARQVWLPKFETALLENLFMPGGRIWYGSGRARGQLLNCVSGQTLVHTRDGVVRARDLAGRTVATLSQGGVYRDALWKHYGKQELCRVEFENGDVIEATSGHRWKVIDPDGRPDQWVETTALEGLTVPLQHVAPTERQLDKFAYRAGIQHGLVYGDGSVNQDGKATIVQFGDSRHLVSEYFERHTMQYHARYPEGVMYVGALSPVLKQEIPAIAEVGSSYVFGFLAGYIAADGNVDDRGTVTLHSASQQALLEVRDLATALGLPTVSLKVVREDNPWTGEAAPLYCLRFAKSGIDPRLIIKAKHREKLEACPISGKRSSARVANVSATGLEEDVYCCDEPVTHTWVASHCYLTGNCFVIPTSDSREGWGRTVSDTIVISGTGGGVGINFSPSRPRGSVIRGTGGYSTGAVSEMEMTNSVGNVIKAGGGRRVALMFALSLNHGDILEFMNKKLDRNELNNANVSVVFDDDPEKFFQLVADDGQWELKHNGEVVGVVPARALWQRLVENACKPRDGQGGGEPGLLNAYLANRMSNIWYLEKLISTNPCGEIWLGPYDCCCLGSVVLPRFVRNGKMQWELLRETVSLGVRFLDDVLTINQYPLAEIAEKCSQLRRIGLGVTGLHHMLLELGLGYTTAAGLEFVDKLMGFIKNASYEASTELASEKGPFPAFRSEPFLQSKFVKTLKPSVRTKIATHGMRNCAVNTIAPVGTGSMVCDTSSAIEPIFSVAYERRFRRGDALAKEVVLDPLFARFQAEGRDTLHFLGAHEITVRDHFEMQRTCQRHIDNAVSKTINLPCGMSVEELSAMYIEYFPDLKGVTVYPNGSREDQPLTPLTREQALALAHAGAATESTSQDSCRSGSCEI